MLLIAFASKLDKPRSSDRSGAKAPIAPEATPLRSSANPTVSDLLNTSFSAAESETVYVNKTVLAVVAKVYLMAVSPELGEFWAKLNDCGSALPVTKNEAFLHDVKQAVDILVAEEREHPKSASIYQQLTEVFSELFEAFSAASNPLSSFWDLSFSPTEILIELTKDLLEDQVKDLLVERLIKQKQIIADYLAPNENATPEKEELKVAVENLTELIKQISSSSDLRLASQIEIDLVNTEPTLELTKVEFHERSDLSRQRGWERTAAKEIEIIEAEQARSRAEGIAEENRLIKIRSYLTALEPEQRLQIASALYQQRQSGPIIQLVTELLQTDPSSSQSKELVLAN